MKKKIEENNAVVITGGSTGLGFALAEEYAARGCRLVLASRSHTELNRARLKLAQRYPKTSVEIFAGDLGIESEAKAFIEKSVLSYGKIDLLINCAGVIQAAPYLNTTTDDFASTLHSNLWSMIHCCRYAIPVMLETKTGRILNVTSVGGLSPVPHLAPYATSKFGAVGYSTTLATELRAKGIYVTTVAPFLMRTGSFGSVQIKGDKQKEYALFTFLDNWKLTSMNAQRAARKMANAADRGLAFQTIGALARIQQIGFALFPNTMVRALSLVAAALPDSDRTSADLPTKGNDLAFPIPNGAVKKRARAAQKDLNQI